MRPLRYSINLTLDGCCDHRVGTVQEDVFRHWTETLARVHPTVVGHGPTLFAGLTKRLDLKLVGRQEFPSGAVAMRYEPA